MTTLWPALILLSLLAMLFVLVPFWRYRNLNTRSMVEQRRAKNTEVFRQRQAELEQDLQQGLTQDDEHARLVAELQRAFLADMQALDSQATAANPWQVGRPVLLALALLIPVASLMLYMERGAGLDLALPDLLQRLGAAESEEAQTATLTELAALLQQRFERNPDDIQNGYMLGTLYIEQEQYQDAIDIFSILVDVMEDGMDKATVLGQLARSMFMADESIMTPRVRNVIGRAQALNPNEYTVLTLLAMDALLNAEPEKAVGYWRRQLLQLDSGSHEAAVLGDRIDRVEELTLSVTAAPADTAIESITVIIDIDDSVRDLVDDSMRLFIYARNPAMSMPLAARNIPLPEFPYEIILDDSMAMMPNLVLSSADKVIVGARLSRSGQASAQPGDIQAVSEPFVPAEQNGPMHLMIREIVGQ